MLLLSVVANVSGCELTEVTLVESDDVLIVEGLVQLRAGPSATDDRDNIRVFMHRTLRADGSSGAVPGATVTVSSPHGWSFEILEADSSECIVVSPDLGNGTCYGRWVESDVIRPGDIAELLIELPDGPRLRASSRLPGDFDLRQPDSDRCVVAPDENFAISWSVADRAWAYVSETTIYGVRSALEPRGVIVEHDTLNLTGLSVSSADTLIVFPSELGVLSRSEIEQDLAVELQGGLPEGTRATVAVAAVDRNFVNWARGGNFNPSGAVRVPSIAGDGTGFFGAAIVRAFDVEVDPDPTGALPSCGPPTSSDS